MIMGYIDPATGEDVEGPPPRDVAEQIAAGQDDTPWYARPRDVILDILGDFTWIGDDVAISSSGGRVIVDVSDRTPSGTPTPAPGQTGGFLTAIGRVPPAVWIGGGALAVILMARR